MEQLDFYSFSREALVEYLADNFSYKSYRADQLFDWVYRKGVSDFSLMSNIAASDRERLSSHFYFPKAIVRDRQISSDGTRKYALEVSPGKIVESVMIKQPTRMTLCVSSQVGCAMGCKFCQTGTMGLKSNLSAGDIVRQVMHVREDAKNFDDDFTNIVFMGMGEPLHNYKSVFPAVKIITDNMGISIAPRKITVSTVGLVPAIEKFATEGLNVNLAVSFNATSDEVRSEIMPVNRKYPIKRLIQAVNTVPLKGRKKITMEYVMLHGVNDTKEDLERLIKIVRQMKVKVNLIPYNDNAELGFKRPPRKVIDIWQEELLLKGVACTVRWSKGLDIDAACGQLISSNKEYVSINKKQEVSN